MKIWERAIEATVGIMPRSLEGGGALSSSHGCGRERGLRWAFVGLSSRTWRSFYAVSSAKKRETGWEPASGETAAPAKLALQTQPSVGGRRRGAETSDTGDGGRFVSWACVRVSCSAQWADVLRPQWCPRKGGRGRQGVWGCPGSALSGGTVLMRPALGWTWMPTPTTQSGHTHSRDDSKDMLQSPEAGLKSHSLPRDPSQVWLADLLSRLMMTHSWGSSKHQQCQDWRLSLFPPNLSEWLKLALLFLTFCGEPSPAAHLVWKFLKDTEGTLFLAKGFLLEFEIALGLSSCLPAASPVPMLWTDAPETLRDCFP